LHLGNDRNYQATEIVFPFQTLTQKNLTSAFSDSFINSFSVAINRDFAGVCAGCADRSLTWISPELIQIYQQLHQSGWAHSFETWQGDQLAGGILGLAIRGVFIGESMFYKIPDGSKIAMVKLVEHLRERDFCLFDAQMQNPHLARFGAYTISEKEYHALLESALLKHCRFV
jgi:leucyl/phenylalanyl-tRNA--protein transferase